MYYENTDLIKPNHGSYLNYIKKLKYMALYIRLLIR